MLMLLSPAKNLNLDPAPDAPAPTQPALLEETATLLALARKLTPAKIKSLMKVSDKLAALNHERFQTFRADNRSNTAKQAALAFAGDVYRGLDANTFSTDDFAYAQERLRILSGLYGLLRPLDAIQPYRLEMSSKLKNPRGGDLYAFWRPVIAREIDAIAAAHEEPSIACLASSEYARAIDRDALKARFVAFNFKEEKDGRTRAIMLYVKQARGMMARWAIRNRIDRLEGLKDFSVDGYKFSKSLSSPDEWVFARRQPPPLARKSRGAAASSTPAELVGADAK